MQRTGWVISIASEKLAEYKALHASRWAPVEEVFQHD